jgi:two-component system chemotaxis response regulator CheY
MRILMVTTETGMGQMSDALSAGADEYIMKPFTPDVVMDKLQLLGL